jgi:tetratricopeptide (TPR) repeat protein
MSAQPLNLAPVRQLAQDGHWQEAALLLERALGQDPGDAAAWDLMAWLRMNLGQPATALAAMDQVLARAPGSARAWHNRGRVLEALRRPDEALQSYEQALHWDPNNLAARTRGAQVLSDSRQYEAALAWTRHGLELAPEDDELQGAAISLLGALGRGDEARAEVARRVARHPRAVRVRVQGAWNEMLAAPAGPAGIAALEGAAEQLRVALGYAPDDAMAHYYLGLVELTLGRFAPGWEGYERRAQVLPVEAGAPAGAPPWLPGEDLAGRSVLLRAEQGLGDILQFSRFARWLADRGARIVLSAPAAAQRLLGSLGAGVQVIDSRQGPPPVERQALLLSAAQRLGVDEASLPGPVPYLQADARDLQAWRTRLAAGEGTPGRLRIGLAWSGNPQHASDRWRSLRLEQLAPLIASLQGQGIAWHALQTQIRAEDEAWLPRLGIADHREHLNDLAQTAALASCLDAIVAVDTAAAHLAGALGRPLLLLLSSAADWRWQRDRHDSPWYPSARLLRQATPGDWAPVFDALRAALIGLAQERRPS